MRQRSLKRHWSGDGAGPRTGQEAWGFVVLLDDALERKGPAVLLCFSGSGSLMPLFLFCRDVKITSAARLHEAESLFAIKGRGWGEYHITTECIHFLSLCGKVTPLTLNLTLLCLISSFYADLRQHSDFTDALFCKIWLLVREKMINERLYLRLFGNYRENRGRGK